MADEGEWTVEDQKKWEAYGAEVMSEDAANVEIMVSSGKEVQGRRKDRERRRREKDEEIESERAQQSAASAPADSYWDGEYYVSNQNPAYVWSGRGWIPRPSAVQQPTAQESTASLPGGSYWDGKYYVSRENPAYVWSGSSWIPRP